MHYYKRNIGDYAKKAGRLTMLQHGAYTLLLDACYDREDFPTLEQAIEWTWASTDAEIEAVKFVLQRFFSIDSDGRFVQTRILEEILIYHKNAETNRRIAIERETKRKEKSTNRDKESTNRVHDVDEASTNLHLTNNHKPITNKKNSSSDDERFIEFWDAFADKRGIDGARRVWNRIKPDEQLAEKIIAGAKRYVKARGTDRKYWKQAQGWLNDRRWEDEIEPVLALVNDTFAGSL